MAVKRALSHGTRLRLCVRVLRAKLGLVPEAAREALDELDTIANSLEAAPVIDPKRAASERRRALRRLDDLLSGGVTLRGLAVAIGENPGTLIHWRKGFWSATGRPLGDEMERRITGRVLKYKG